MGGLYNKGINRIDLKTGRVKNYVSRPGDSTGIDDSNIFAITRLSTGELLFATPIGVNVYNAAEDNFTRIPQLVNVFVKSMLEDYLGNLWFATNNEGVWCRTKSGQWCRYVNNPADAGSLSYNAVNYIIEDRKNRLWFCTDRRRGVPVESPGQDVPDDRRKPGAAQQCGLRDRRRFERASLGQHQQGTRGDQRGGLDRQDLQLFAADTERTL